MSGRPNENFWIKAIIFSSTLVLLLCPLVGFAPALLGVYLSDLSGSQTITYGTPYIILSGQLDDSSGGLTNQYLYVYLSEPDESLIGQQETNTDSQGNFNFAYVVSNVPPSSTPYPIIYYAGNTLPIENNGETTLTVNPLPVVLTGSMPYDGTTTVAAANLSVSNAINGDIVYVTGSATLASSNAGPEAITTFQGLTLAGPSATNYTLIGASGTVTITSVAATITINVAPFAGGTVTGGGSYAAGSQVEISATPATGCTFYGWNDGDTNNPRTITVPPDGATYIADFLPPANITFYHQVQSSIFDHGHVFLGITPPVGQTSYYGFYPIGNPFLCPAQGAFVTDIFLWDDGISYPITLAQYEAATNLIDSELINPPHYCLMTFNCTDWAASIASAAGLTLPNYQVCFLPIELPVEVCISAPSVFGIELQSLGVGTVYDNGVVIAHDPPATDQPPYDYDYLGIESMGHTNPIALAASLGATNDPINLGAVVANNTSGLSLSINGADASEDLISMNWGDGSALQEQSLTFKHVYTNGTYSADLLIVDAGAVHSYTMTVTVSSAAAASIPVNVTSFPPSNAPNPGLSPASPVPGFSVVGMPSLSILSNGQPSISCHGVPGWSYTIWETTNVTQAFVPIGSATSCTNGVFHYEDTNTVDSNTRFYRVTYP